MYAITGIKIKNNDSRFPVGTYYTCLNIKTNKRTSSFTSIMNLSKSVAYADSWLMDLEYSPGKDKIIITSDVLPTYEYILKNHPELFV